MELAHSGEGRKMKCHQEAWATGAFLFGLVAIILLLVGLIAQVGVLNHDVRVLSYKLGACQAEMR